MSSPEAFVPIDRCYALAEQQILSDSPRGAALFADISGFTPLTLSLVNHHGPRRGAEMMAQQLNRVYDALITPVHAYGGSVIGFSGGGVTCWYDGDDERRTPAVH